MIPAGPAAVPTSLASPASARALIERQVAVLTRLTEIGMEIAEAAGRRAAAAPDPGEPEDLFRGDPGLAFTRVARAVRLTIALQSRLLADLAALDRADAAADEGRRLRRRRGLERLVEAALDSEPGVEAGDGDEIRRLCDDAREWLRDADEEAELTGRPFAEAVAEICRDLGLSPEWTARMVALAGEGGGPAAVAPPAFAPPPPDRRSGRVPAARPWPPPRLG